MSRSVGARAIRSRLRARSAPKSMALLAGVHEMSMRDDDTQGGQGRHVLGLQRHRLVVVRDTDGYARAGAAALPSFRASWR
jgi:hypothetical protein